MELDGGAVKQKGYALVLSGGGTKGIYHIGAWKALREMEIRLDAVIGTSIGAIIAGFIAQNDYEKAEKALSHVGIEKVIAIPGEFIKDGKFAINKQNIAHLRKIQKSFASILGLDTAPLRRFIETNLDEKTIRQSGMDLGMVTYKISKMMPVVIFMDDIEEGLLFDYMLASASFPGFSPVKIKEESYIDGGVYNNIPFSLAKERGYKKIIVLDISGFGAVKEMDTSGTDTVYIKNSIDMGWLLDFDKSFLADFRELGYLDTLRAFGKIDGIDYFYTDDNGSVLQSLEKTFIDPDFLAGNRHLFAQENGTPARNIRAILPKYMRHRKDLIRSLAECAALCLAIERIRLWSFGDFIAEIEKRYVAIESEVADITRSNDENTIIRIAKQIADLVKNTDLGKLFHAPLYKYERILEEIARGRKMRLKLATLSPFFPNLAPARLFFSLLEHSKLVSGRSR
jgi:NTE family protein